MRFFKILSIVSALSTLVSCSRKMHVQESPAGKKISNYSYGNSKKQTFDIHIPANNDSAKPVAVLIHGGSWVRGGKWMLNGISASLAKQGYSTVNMNYSLCNKKINVYQQLNDVKTVLAEADSILGTDPGRKFVLIGESAGGHLAMQYGFTNNSNIESIISLSGPTMLYGPDYTESFKRLVALRLLNKVTGTGFKTAGGDSVYRSLSPLNNVSSVPTLMIHGNLDPLVNLRQARAMENKLFENNIPHKLIVIKGCGHVPRLNPYVRNKVMMPEMLGWLEGNY